MPLYTIEKIAEVIHAKKIIFDGSALIDELLTDSRRIINPSTSIFFSLTGPRRKGQQFIPDLYQRGVRSFVIDDGFNTKDYKDANFLVVENPLIALQQLVAFHRASFSVPVIGITGSNGKTIVKEWLNLLLESDYNIVRSPKSFNSQIGVPLSVWEMNETDTLGIFEAGISLRGEMMALQKIIQPTIGVLTHIGDAHSENFTSIDEKIREKLFLFKDVKWMVANGDIPFITHAIAEAGIPVIFWGTTPECVIQVSNIEKHKTYTSVILSRNNALKTAFFSSPGLDDCTIQIPFTDDASIENAITCCCVLAAMGYSSSNIANRVTTLKQVGMRLEMKKGINNCSIINDSYIADLSSLYIALSFLDQQKQHSKRTVILSDFLETGIHPDQLYQEIATALQQKNVTRFIGIGAQIVGHKDVFEQACAETSFYNSTEEYIQRFHSNTFRDETILIKGARIFSFERISMLLEQKAHQTVLEINLNAVVHNLQQYQRLLQPSTKVMAMVKAFSYGSGTYEIANILQFHKIDYLAVAYIDEGVELRKAGITLPIMVMNPEENSFATMTEHYLEPEIFSFSMLNLFLQHLQEQALKHYPVHIKIDTGMHRLGFELKDMPALGDILKNNTAVKVQSVFSHLSGSEDPSLDNFTQQQANEYLAACALLQEVLPTPFLKHIANSAAVARHKQLHFDMVRLGIGLYGVDSTATSYLHLKEVATLKTTIAQIKNIKSGDTVGYGRKGVVKKDSTIATIRIGYADGYRRSMGNSIGYVLIHGKKAPVIGNIAMDMTMVDITGIQGVTEHDEVIVFGEQLPVTTLAQWAETIPYEIMTGISQRVPRVYFEE
ncbi:MAG: bifunctional UDP-N-acetylmuramoyl-tripeptide:D-alanyl-D-alanine ligase/alanine racemase [Agriterribacter sp.]